MKVVSSLDDQTLKNAVHTLTFSYRPQMLKDLVNTLPAKRQGIRMIEKPVYVPPPRVRDAEQYWPYMRCKNVARAFHRVSSYYKQEPLPRSHYGLLVYLAGIINVDVEKFKKTSPKELFKDDPYVSEVIGYRLYWYC